MTGIGSSVNMAELTNDVNVFNIYGLLTSVNFRYLIVETKYTKHYIERLMPSCSDRGKIKWIAETKTNELDFKDEETKKSLINGADLFPRLYFQTENFLSEFVNWLEKRNLKIISVEEASS